MSDFVVEEEMSEYLPKEEFAELMMQRIKSFALRSIRVVQSLPTTIESTIMAKQLVRSASSAAANYRAVRRARSRNEFYAKLSITIEELDEANFWLEMLIDTNILPAAKLSDLIKEGYELLAILSKARKNTKLK